MSAPVNSNNMGTRIIMKAIKLSREYPKSLENAKLLKQYLDKNGRRQER